MAGLRKSRFIPTRVGNTRVEAEAMVVQPVHPHARGEHTSSRLAKVLKGGSSPRAWGTQIGTNASNRVVRFIPTRVGNTASIMS